MQKYTKIGRRTAHMTKDDRIASFKYSVLQHAQKHNNITYWTAPANPDT